MTPRDTCKPSRKANYVTNSLQFKKHNLLNKNKILNVRYKLKLSYYMEYFFKYIL